MDDITTEAVIGCATFDNLMQKLCTTQVQTSVTTMRQIHRDEMINAELEILEPALAGVAKWYGMAYETPMLTKVGEELLLCSWVLFIKRYTRAMEESLRSPMPGFICI